LKITEDIFYKHETSIKNEVWNVSLSYESSNAKELKIEKLKNIPIIEIVENGKFYSAIKIDVTNNQKKKKSCILTGIDGAFILYGSGEENDYQSVLINNNNILLSLGFSLVSIDLKTLKLNWKIRPDTAEIFEFYKYKNDIILRGELAIHRINIESGKSIWEFGGRDIWINMDGKEEVNIENNGIRLFDFESNEYLIDFNGNLLEDKPRVSKIKSKKATIMNNPKKWFYNKLWNLVQNKNQI